MRVIVVPVNGLDSTKSRLSSVLSPSERAVLTLAMLEDVLDACVAQAGWEVRVVSRAEAALEIAARRGARCVQEQGRALLAAIDQAQSDVRGRQSQLAVVLADLPLLTAPGLARGLALGANASVVAARAHSDGGTNLLLRRPPSAIAARFGRSSFSRHRAEAYRRGVTFREARIAELAFDLDRPADIRRVLESPRASRTRAVCLDLGLAARLSVHV
jgi:2-phospho-L-lactate/phosphoenolpyruvate guanylyltransferase